MKREMLRYLGLLAFSGALLVGCKALPPGQPTPPEPEAGTVSVDTVDTLLTMLDRFSHASPGELLREYEALAAQEPKSAADGQLRLALLLSQPGLPFRDDAAALRVLQAWEKRQTRPDPGVAGFVRWLRAMLGEQLRVAGAMDETGIRLREERKRAEACRDKLEAIKSMERSLIERDKR